MVLVSHFWQNRVETPEGCYYGPVTLTTSFLGPLKASAIQNHWVHYVLVSDTSGVSLFQDGIRIGAANIPGAAVSGNWFLGKHWWYTDPGSLVYSERVLGRFKNLKIYSRVLSDTEVRQLYAQESGPFVSFVKAFTLDYSGLTVGTDYQLQASSDLISWTNWGTPFIASAVNYSNTVYQRVDDWNKLFFRLAPSP